MIRLERGRLVVGLHTPKGKALAKAVLSAFAWETLTRPEWVVVHKIRLAIENGLDPREPLAFGPDADQWNGDAAYAEPSGEAISYTEFLIEQEAQGE